MRIMAKKECVVSWLVNVAVSELMNITRAGRRSPSHWRKKQGGWGGGGAVAPPSCQPSGPKPRKIFILLGLDIFRFVM